MARKGKLSRDQKRKKKLAARAKGEAGRVEPYKGNKYKSDYYVDTMLQTETGIYESYVITGRKLTDQQVRHSLEYLIHQLRGEHPEPPSDNPQTEGEDGRLEDLVAGRIKANWDDLFTTRPRHSPAELVGILRTLLSSIHTWTRPGPDARGYLDFIEGFLAKAGVHVEVNEEIEEQQEPPTPPPERRRGLFSRLFR